MKAGVYDTFIYQHYFDTSGIKFQQFTVLESKLLEACTFKNRIGNLFYLSIDIIQMDFFYAEVFLVMDPLKLYLCQFSNMFSKTDKFTRYISVIPKQNCLYSAV